MIWNLLDHSETPLVLSNHEDEVWFLLIDKKEAYLYSASSDGIVLQWNLKSLEMVPKKLGHFKNLIGISLS